MPSRTNYFFSQLSRLPPAAEACQPGIEVAQSGVYVGVERQKFGVEIRQSGVGFEDGAGARHGGCGFRKAAVPADAYGCGDTGAQAGRFGGFCPYNGTRGDVGHDAAPEIAGRTAADGDEAFNRSAGRGRYPVSGEGLLECYAFQQRTVNFPPAMVG